MIFIYIYNEPKQQKIHNFFMFCIHTQIFIVTGIHSIFRVHNTFSRKCQIFIENIADIQ